MLVDGLAAVLGIIGGGVALSRPKLGGWVLLAGVAIGFAGWLVSLGEAVGKGVGATTVFFLLLVFFLWWALLMLIGGLLAITREPTRPASPAQT